MIREGPARYFAVVSRIDFGLVPTVWAYEECEPDQKCPIYVESEPCRVNQNEHLQKQSHGRLFRRLQH